MRIELDVGGDCGGDASAAVGFEAREERDVRALIHERRRVHRHLWGRGSAVVSAYMQLWLRGLEPRRDERTGFGRADEEPSAK